VVVVTRNAPRIHPHNQERNSGIPTYSDRNRLKPTETDFPARLRYRPSADFCAARDFDEPQSHFRRRQAALAFAHQLPVSIIAGAVMQPERRIDGRTITARVPFPPEAVLPGAHTSRTMNGKEDVPRPDTPPRMCAHRAERRSTQRPEFPSSAISGLRTARRRSQRNPRLDLLPRESDFPHRLKRPLVQRDVLPERRGPQ